MPIATQQGDRDRPGDRPLRLAHLLPQRGQPRVPGEREEHQARRRRHPAEAAGHGHPLDAARSGAGDPRRDDDREHDEHHGEQHPRQPGAALHTPGAQRGGDDERARRGRPRVRGPGVRADGEGHRRARRRLPRDEAPAGEVSPARPEQAAGVDVRPAGPWEDRGQPGRRGRVAPGDQARDEDRQRQPGAGGTRRGPGRREDAGPEHRPQPDRDGVGRAQPAGETGLATGRHPATASCSRPSRTCATPSSAQGGATRSAAAIASGCPSAIA